MSLLLEALKKAELAKQAAQPETPAAASEQAKEIALVEPREPVITRESLPDISQPLEIRTEDFARAPHAKVGTKEEETPALILDEPNAREPDDTPAPSVEPRQAAATQNRDAARQLFDVKEVDYNPRRPFQLTVAALVTAGVAYGVYLWWQMQPHYAVNTAALQNSPKAVPAPVAPPAETPPATGLRETAATQPAAAPAAPAVKPAVPAPKMIAAVPEARARIAAKEEEVFHARGGPSATAAAAANRATSSTVKREQPDSSRNPQPGRITITPPTMRPDPGLEAAYEAYQRGELQNAREQYQRLLERDPGNRDALLGLAAIDLRERNFETAELRYLRLLELNPRDTYAVAGLMALQGNVDPVQSESRIKTLIASQPEATHLYFTLGNQYAAQGRWGEAEEAYFKAYSANPENPDYAFNVAVSLDRLRQAKPALEYYGKALALAARQPAAFSRAQAEARAEELAR